MPVEAPERSSEVVEETNEGSSPYYTVIPDDDEDLESIMSATGLSHEDAALLIPNREEEDETGTEEGAEGTEETPAVEEAPVAEVPAVTPPVDEESKRFADWGRKLQEAFGRDPQGTIKSLVDSAMTDEQKAGLIAQLGGKYEKIESKALPQDWKPDSAFEEIAAPHTEWLTKGQKAVSDALMQRDNDIRLTYTMARAQNIAMQTALEALGVSLPALDTKAVMERLRLNPQESLDDAIEEAYGKSVREAGKAAKTAIEARRQVKETPRPSTPRSGSSGGTGNTAKVKTASGKTSMISAYIEAGKDMGLD